jgi:hypothetical protein
MGEKVNKYRFLAQFVDFLNCLTRLRKDLTLVYSFYLIIWMGAVTSTRDSGTRFFSQ